MKQIPGNVILFCQSDFGHAVDCVDWALDALCAGEDSPSLRILAGLTPPFYSLEVRQYAIKALKELGIEIPAGEDVIASCARALIEDILIDPECMEERLSILHKLYICADYREDLHDFDLLYWAFDDLQAGEVQYYWDGATRENIHEIVLDRCREWINEYDSQTKGGVHVL
ncbi:MAG: hypothetical protein AAF572_17805 [Cyanobacteria bacterium P01_B01_bin.77]